MLSTALSEALLGHSIDYDNTRVGVHELNPLIVDDEILGASYSELTVIAIGFVWFLSLFR